MTDRPIIFSGPMVRALLDGRKTMTRRLVTPNSCNFGSAHREFWKHADFARARPDRGFPLNGVHSSGYLHVPCHEDYPPRDEACERCLELGWEGTSHRLYPRVQPGDRLWVRENFARVGSVDPGYPLYAATWRDDARAHKLENIPEKGPKWTPCIHMPRTVSRLTLIVTAVKVERLHAITEEDARAEGIYQRNPGELWSAGGVTAGACPRSGFMMLWKELHGMDAWDANPFVVAISFSVTKQNIDTLPRAEAA
jgi:hypothetical protein